MINEIDWKSADNIFKTFDVNKDGVLDEKEFFLLCEKFYGEEEVNKNEWRVKEIFKIFSLNDEGLKESKWKRYRKIYFMRYNRWKYVYVIF